MKSDIELSRILNLISFHFLNLISRFQLGFFKDISPDKLINKIRFNSHQRVHWESWIFS